MSKSNSKYEIGRGFPATFGFVIAALLAILLIQFLHTRELKQKRAAELPDAEAADSEEGSSYGNKNKEEVDVVETGNFQELASAGAVIS
jgi:ACS family pantothenate transporter-like MFS transporter